MFGGRRTDGERMEELMRRAGDALDTGDSEAAEELSRQVLRLNSDSLEAKDLLASAIMGQERFGEAVPLLTDLTHAFPDDASCLVDLGLCLFQVCEFAQASSVVRRALAISPLDPHANYLAGLCEEREGRIAMADERFRLAARQAPEDYTVPIRLSREEFDAALTEALDELPGEIRDALDTVAVLVEDVPAEHHLRAYDPPLDPLVLGLYTGVPRDERSTGDLPGLPDVVNLYQRNLEHDCTTRDGLVREIRTTVLHEVGHYLGFDEEELETRGLS